MTPRSQWPIVKRIFEHARHLNKRQRAAYLDQACPQENLRQEVESLLLEHDNVESFPGLYTTIAGKVLSHYQILGRVGDGGMAIVYQARDRRLGRLVAIKVSDPLDLGNAASQKRLIDEARHASALNHPNIVTIHETGRAKGLCYIVMEYVAGKTLDRAIPPRGWPVPEALRYGAQIADALATAHRNGIVHGDLKPGNIMVTDTGYVKLLDFGLAHALDGGKHESRRKRPAARFGTKAYMAPELLNDRSRQPDPRSEVFSFGLILHQMLTGRHPFGRGTPEKLAQAICSRQPRALPENVPAPIVGIVERSLRKNPDERYPSMHYLWSALTHSEVTESTPFEGAASPGSFNRSAELRPVRSLVNRIGYLNIAESRSALSKLESLMASGTSLAARQMATSSLRQMILTMPDSGGNGIPRSVRELRKAVLKVLKAMTESHLSECFKENDLEYLDLYEMDLAAADLGGLSFKGSFPVGANCKGSRLVRTSFAGACVRNVNFEGADLAEADFTDADWFNALGLTGNQLARVRRDTLMNCPEDFNAMHCYLAAHYGFPFESWSVAVQEQLKMTWTEYLQPGGLRDIVAGWRQNSGEIS